MNTDFVEYIWSNNKKDTEYKLVTTSDEGRYAMYLLESALNDVFTEEKVGCTLFDLTKYDDLFKNNIR